MYLHFVWVNWDKLPLVTSDVQEVIYTALVSQCDQLKCKVVAIGGVAAHVYLLTDFPPALTVFE
ncbi:transposase [Funiculus sociatus GB2-M2]|uniref:transposase n=1 Tax=Trichocoleus sp. FACHB-90 TaxID=2692876 RepID=UPI0018EF996F